MTDEINGSKLRPLAQRTEREVRMTDQERHTPKGAPPEEAVTISTAHTRHSNQDYSMLRSSEIAESLATGIAVRIYGNPAQALQAHRISTELLDLL